MAYRCFALREVLITVVVIGILSALLVPRIGGHGRHTRMACANNLRRLYQLSVLYGSTHKGALPEETGGALWLSFAWSTPPLIDPHQIEVLNCPILGEEPTPGRTDYLGPRKSMAALKPTEALAADRPGNHGEDEGGNVLLKDGSVHYFDRDDPIWDTLKP